MFLRHHTSDTQWVKIHSVRKILAFSIFHRTSHFLRVTLRLCASALKSTAVFRLNESNRKGKLSRWRKALPKKNDRERKRKEKCRKERPHGGVARKTTKAMIESIVFSLSRIVPRFQSLKGFLQPTENRKFQKNIGIEHLHKA